MLDADSPTDFVQRVMATQSVTDSQSEVIDQLNADKAVLAAREQQMQVTEEAIEATEAEAEEQVEQLQKLVAEAREAKSEVKSLIADARGRVAGRRGGARGRGAAARRPRGGAGGAAGADRPGGVHRNGHRQPDLAAPRLFRRRWRRVAGAPGLRLPQLPHRRRHLRPVGHRDHRGAWSAW